MSNSTTKKCLVTADLINSINWMLKAPNVIVKGQSDPLLTWSKKAYQDLVNKLNRVYGDMPLAAQRGIDFENKVYACVEKNKLNVGSKNFQKVLESVRGFKFQEKIKKDERIGEYDCFLYGKVDAIKKNHIIDLKTTGNYSPSNFNNDSFQAQLYSYITKIHYFSFVVAEWLDYPQIANTHISRCFFPDMNDLQKRIHEKVTSAFQTLKDYDLWEVYRDKFCLH